jgi:hypothetical protein
MHMARGLVQSILWARSKALADAVCNVLIHLVYNTLPIEVKTITEIGMLHRSSSCFAPLRSVQPGVELARNAKTTMSSLTAHSDLPLASAAASHVQPCPPMPSQAHRLLQLLSDCCHPRATLLREQLDADPDARQIACLRDEVLRLLTVCYDAAEVRRRLHELELT